MKFHQATVDTLDGRKPAATSNKDEDASQPPRPPVPQPPPSQGTNREVCLLSDNAHPYIPDSFSLP